jgi:hypothetical protein
MARITDPFGLHARRASKGRSTRRAACVVAALERPLRKRSRGLATRARAESPAKVSEIQAIREHFFGSAFALVPLHPSEEQEMRDGDSMPVTILSLEEHAELGGRPLRTDDGKGLQRLAGDSNGGRRVVHFASLGRSFSRSARKCGHADCVFGLRGVKAHFGLDGDRDELA